MTSTCAPRGSLLRGWYCCAHFMDGQGEVGGASLLEGAAGVTTSDSELSRRPAEVEDRRGTFT